ncbi:MAG: hypothetical protein ACC642_05130 [Pseudomonadales bacterium]
MSVQRRHFDRILEMAEAVVVRPDRYVFGHTTDNLTLDDLLRELATRLCLTQGTGLTRGQLRSNLARKVAVSGSCPATRPGVYCPPIAQRD